MFGEDEIGVSYVFNKKPAASTPFQVRCCSSCGHAPRLLRAQGVISTRQGHGFSNTIDVAQNDRTTRCSPDIGAIRVLVERHA